MDLEILHTAGGFILGAGAYQHFFIKKGEKANIAYLIIAGFAGYLFVELILHGGG